MNVFHLQAICNRCSHNLIYPPQVPGGLLPVLEIDGRVVTESSVIMALLEEEFPEHRPLMPVKGTQERARADGLMRLEREWRHGQGGQDDVLHGQERIF